MNNPPFSIGQKVVCISDDIVNDSVDRLVKGKEYTIAGPCSTYKGNYDISELLYSSCDGLPQSYHGRYFAPIITNYSDATTEILEKFKSPAERPDKILTPEKVTNQ